MRVDTLLDGSSRVAGDYVKSQTAFTEYYSSYGFYGTLITLSTNSMYKLKSRGGELRVWGAPTPLPKTFTFSRGWSYLPCPYPRAVPLAAGLPVRAYEVDDLVKSQSDFAMYYAQFGWYGLLSQLEPGKGYEIQTAAGGEGTFMDR